MSRTTKSMQDNTLASQSTSVISMITYDEILTNQFNQDYSLIDVDKPIQCPPLPNITSVSPGSATIGLCTYWDGQYNSIDFSPNTAFGVTEQCSDDQPAWIYQIDQSTLPDELKVSIDSAANKIWVKGLLEGATNIGATTYTATVNGYLPGTTQTASFTFSVDMSTCSQFGLDPPSTISDQVYYVTYAREFYEVPSFTNQPGCDQTITYSNEVIAS